MKEGRTDVIDLADTLDRVLDKGIVLDAWARFGSAPIDLSGSDRLVVTSSQTYLAYLTGTGSDAKALDSGS